MLQLDNRVVSGFRLGGERLCHQAVLRPGIGEVFQRPPAAEHLNPNAAAKLLTGENLDQAHLSAACNMGAAAGTAVGAGKGDNANLPIQSLFTAV